LHCELLLGEGTCGTQLMQRLQLCEALAEGAGPGGGLIGRRLAGAEHRDEAEPATAAGWRRLARHGELARLRGGHEVGNLVDDGAGDAAVGHDEAARFDHRLSQVGGPGVLQQEHHRGGLHG
jgi:hypothetical protein